MASLLRDYPELRTFLLQNVRLTGTKIGSGAYGTVEEGEIPGAVCAVKRIHDIFQDRSEIPPDEIRSAAEQFVEECRLMTTLRHPNIVQFLGICVLPRSRLPALVMERLLTSLHDLLETRPNIPLGLKHSFLCDIAKGISYLHNRSTPLVHRDLSARNILLSTAMTAKIGDLGVARIVPSLRVATMTKAPGASVYMPPEAVEDESRYDMTIDIFALGVVAIFTLTQRFPQKVLAQVYQDQNRRVVVRSELERRVEYVQQIYNQFREGHPLVQMIKQCLGSFPNERPAIQQVVQLLEQARAEIDDDECYMDRLALVQTVKELVLSKNQEIESKHQEIETKNQELKAKSQEIESKDEQIREMGQEMASKQRQIQSQQAEIEELRKQTSGLADRNQQSTEQSIDLTQQMKSPQAAATATDDNDPFARRSHSKQPKKKINKADIGLPSNFRHWHLAQTGTCDSNITPEWKKLEDLLTNEQLEDKATADGYIKKHGGIEEANRQLEVVSPAHRREERKEGGRHRVPPPTPPFRQKYIFPPLTPPRRTLSLGSGISAAPLPPLSPPSAFPRVAPPPPLPLRRRVTNDQLEDKACAKDTYP